MKRSATICLAVTISACSLFGPPLPPASPTPDLIEYEAKPVRARQALVECARKYGSRNARAADVSAELVVDAAIYACSSELNAYRAIAAERARSSARILGWIDRSESRAKEALDEATAEARNAALDAVIRARADQ